MKKIGYIIILFLLHFPCFLKGEESYYFRRFGIDNGLPHNTVSCIIQDRQGFMWFGTKDGLSRYDGYTFKTFKHDKKDKNSIGNNFIRSLYQDENGDIWVGTDDGIYIYHPETERFLHFDQPASDGTMILAAVNDIKCDRNGNIWLTAGWQGVFLYDFKKKELVSFRQDVTINAWCVCIDRDNKVWIGTHRNGLGCYDQQLNRFESIRVSIEGENNLQDDIYRVFFDNYNDILIGTANGGIKKLNLIDKQLKPFMTEIEGDKQGTLFIRDIMRRSDNELWIATESGIYIYNTQKQTVKNLRHEHADPFSISDNAIYSIYKDREEGIWIGTYFGGINYYPPQYSPFKRIYPMDNTSGLKGKRIREFQQDVSGGIWIGTEDAGLNYFNPVNRTFKNFTSDGKQGSLAYSNIHGLQVDGDKIWVGTFAYGMNVIDIKTQQVIRYYKKTEDPNSLCNNNVFSIYRDHSGNLWVGTINGLNLYNPQNDNFTKIAYTGNTFIYDIFESYDGILWFASFGSGLFRYNPRNDDWKVFLHNQEDSTSICHNKIISIFEDSKRNLWLTTEGGGISQLNPAKENFISYTTDNGLPNNVVYKILEDNNQQLWLSTNNGLCCFNPVNKTFKTYTQSDGLPGNPFNYKSGLKSPDGELYFGCLNGFISFNPSSFSENKFIPPVIITDFRLFNKGVTIGDKNSPLKKSISYTNEIKLKHNQSSFSFDFAALSYTAPEKNKYAYILKGFEREWTTMSDNHSITYSNLPPGDYVFQVKGSNSDGIWNESATGLKISIYPPFYSSKPAYFVYLLFLIGFVMYLLISFKKRIDYRNKRKLELFENEKDKELYQAKIAFFTNIAHEIRTPLSLIKGPLDHILTENINEEERSENLEVIRRNTNRLLDLSNQLLDFRKVEEKGFQLNYMNTDIKQLILDIYTRFKPTVLQKGLSFELQFPEESLFADVDREAFTKIISNLFTNAIKYGISQIVLILEYCRDANKENEASHFAIRVTNNGNIIPEDKKEKIFQPFYQIDDENGNKVNQGTGLGLPLARSLAELHHGNLYFDASSGALNVFVLRLPLKQLSSISIQKENENQVEEYGIEEKATPSAKPTLLIVEDDKEMVQFLQGKLKNQYHVAKALNGKIALEELAKEEVDIVVTDIMMPEKDGLKLCTEIKSNVHYSHIPVIILTAKSDLKSKIEGLDAGADAYVEKPFSMEHLSAQISNLLSNRNKIKQAFINSPSQNIGSIAVTKADENFLEKVTQIINKNLSDTFFNVDSLSEELHMSRSSLHRKIKGISELTPNDFIQLVRLKRAADLLKEGSYRISEICFLVGFNSSSYFSKSFKKQFGMSPKDFVKKKEG